MTQAQCVYVIGAGFSAGLGFPLVSDLLVRLWRERGNEDLIKQLKPIIQFHHPGFDERRLTSFPNIEQLLSEIQVNDELFYWSRENVGNFRKCDLRSARKGLLMEISRWFHEISNCVMPVLSQNHWLNLFRKKVNSENAAIISFNWDLIIDELLFGNEINGSSYGFENGNDSGPVLLKPHGSLNWFEGELDESQSSVNCTMIFSAENSDGVYAFRDFREPKSAAGRIYTPLIVPPVYLKHFENKAFKMVWRKCTRMLSRAKKIIFLGYSLPAADIHARFILRCGFYNQLHGEIASGNGRKDPTGPADVIVVNPDIAATRRVESVVRDKHTVVWCPSPVREWMQRHDD